MTLLRDLMARNLGISRAAAVRLIEAGRVTDSAGNHYSDRRSSISDDPAIGAVTVIVDDQPVALWSSAFVLLHKPVGVVTALRDARHPTAYALLENAPLFGELRPIGRLDLESAGLLLWTTEGALVQRLTHPKRRVPRTYQAVLTAPFRPPASQLVLQDGHRPELLELKEITREEAHPALVRPSDAGDEGVLASVTIIGGAYHEVRRIFAALGSHVVQLCRTRFGPYTLPVDLPAGGWRAVAQPADR